MTESTNPQAVETQCPDSLTVMYDGACPLCRREVSVYQGLKPLQPLQWLDVSATTTTFEDVKDRSRFMARFHVRRADGELLSGAKAFVALWLQLPGWRWLGRVASLPGATALLELFYVGFLRIRPALQRVVKAYDGA